MAVTILTQPPAIGLVKPKLIYKVQGGKFLQNIGDENIAQLQITSSPQNGHTMNLEWTGVDEVFTFTTATPDDTGRQLPAHVSGTLNNYLENTLIPKLRENYLVNRDFVLFWAGAGIILFVARNIGNAYKISGTASFTISISNDPANLDQVISDNYSLQATIITESEAGNGIFIRLPDVHHIPATDKNTEFDVTSFLLPYLGTMQPDLAQTTLRLIENLSLKYFTEFTEIFGDPAVFNKVTTSAQRTAIKGGLRYEDYPGHKDIVNNWLKPEKQWLTWRPVMKEATEDQFEWLYWLGYEHPLDEIGQDEMGNPVVINHKFQYKTIIYYEDGTTHTQVTLEFDTPDYEIGQILCFPAGVKQLGLHLINPTKTIRHWGHFIIHDTGSPQMTITTFYQAVPCTWLDRHFFYENSYGVFDTLRAKGFRDEGIRVEKEEFFGIVPSGYTATDAQLSDFNEEYEEPEEASTGLMKKDELHTLRDFVISRNIYMLEGDTLIRVKVLPDEFSFFRKGTDSDFLYGFSFKYKKAYKQQNHSNAV